MKYLLWLLLLFPVLLYSQNETAGSTVIMELADVDKAPVYPGCTEEEFFACSFNRITVYLLDHIDKQVLAGLDPEESVINLKLIIDNTGKIRRVMAQGESEELKKEGIRVARQLPDFTPASFEGKTVNVIVDIPIKLESEDPLPFNSDLYDTPAMAKECSNKNSTEEALRCTSEFVQKYFQRNLNRSKIETKNQLVKVVFHFVINESGKPTNVTATGIDQNLIKEGLRVINKMPDFIPATKDGKKVKVSYNFPTTAMVKTFR